MYILNATEKSSMGIRNQVVEAPVHYGPEGKIFSGPQQQPTEMTTAPVTQVENAFFFNYSLQKDLQDHSSGLQPLAGVLHNGISSPMADHNGISEPSEAHLLHNGVSAPVESLLHDDVSGPAKALAAELFHDSISGPAEASLRDLPTVESFPSMPLASPINELPPTPLTSSIEDLPSLLDGVGKDSASKPAFPKDGVPEIPSFLLESIPSVNDKPYIPDYEKTGEHQFYSATSDSHLSLAPLPVTDDEDSSNQLPQNWTRGLDNVNLDATSPDHCISTAYIHSAAIPAAM